MLLIMQKQQKRKKKNYSFHFSLGIDKSTSIICRNITSRQQKHNPIKKKEKRKKKKPEQ